MREPPKPLRRFAGLFESIDWLAGAVQWLIDESINLQHGQEQLTHMAGELSAQVSAVKTGVSNLGQALTDIAARIETELQQVADAIANGNTEEAAQAVTDLQGVNADLASLGQQATALSERLASDDPAAPTP